FLTRLVAYCRSVLGRPTASPDESIVTGQRLCPRRSGHIALCVGETLYVWGGFQTPTDGEARATPFPPQDLWRYSASGDFWTCGKCTGSTASCPKPTVGARGVKVGNYLYVLGGWSSPDGYSRQVYRLDLTSYQWDNPETVPDKGGLSGRFNFAAWKHSDSIYCFGGYGYKPCNGEFVGSRGRQTDALDIGWNNDLVKLDIIAKQNTTEHRWSNPEFQGTAPSPRSGHAAALLGNKLYIFGGQCGAQVMNDLHCLDLRERPKWSELESSAEVPQARYFHSLTAVDKDRLLLFGGLTARGPLDDLWLLTPQTPEVQWLQLRTGTSFSRHYHTACCTQSGNVLVFGGSVDNIMEYSANRGRFSEEILEFQMKSNPLEGHQSRAKVVVDLRERLPEDMRLGSRGDVVDSPVPRVRTFADVHKLLPPKWPDKKVHNPASKLHEIKVQEVEEDDNEMRGIFDAVCAGLDESIYRMQQNKRGIFLLINNQKGRKGSKVDRDVLKKVFGELHFDVHVETDCTAEDSDGTQNVLYDSSVDDGAEEADEVRISVRTTERIQIRLSEEEFGTEIVPSGADILIATATLPAYKMDIFYDLKPLLFSMSLVGLYFDVEEAAISTERTRKTNLTRRLGHKVYCLLVCGALWFQFLRYIPVFWVGVDYVEGLTAPRLMCLLWLFQSAFSATLIFRGCAFQDRIPLFFKLCEDLQDLEENSNASAHTSNPRPRQQARRRNETSRMDLEGADERMKDKAFRHKSCSGACLVRFQATDRLLAENVRCKNRPKHRNGNGQASANAVQHFESRPPSRQSISCTGDKTGRDNKGKSSRSLVIKMTIVSWIASCLNSGLVGLFLTGVFKAAESTVIIHTNPFGSSIPVRVFVLSLHFLSSFSWVFPVFFSCAVSLILVNHFNKISNDLSESILKSGGKFPDELETLKRRHALLCDCVSVLDRILRQLAMTYFVVNIPMCCFTLYNLMNYTSDVFGLVMYGFWLSASITHVLLFSVTAALVHEAFLRCFVGFWVGVDFESGLTAQRIMTVLWFFQNALYATILFRSCRRSDHIQKFFETWDTMGNIVSACSISLPRSGKKGSTNRNVLSAKSDVSCEISLEQEAGAVSLSSSSNSVCECSERISAASHSDGAPEKERKSHGQSTEDGNRSLHTRKQRNLLTTDAANRSQTKGLKRRRTDNETPLFNCHATTRTGNRTRNKRSMGELHTYKTGEWILQAPSPLELETEMTGNEVKKTRRGDNWKGLSLDAETCILDVSPEISDEKRSRRLAVRVTVLTWILFALNSAVVAFALSGVFEAADSMLIVYTSPFGLSVPVRVMVFILTLADSCAWLFTPAFFCTIAALFISQFQKLHTQLKDLIHQQIDRYPEKLEGIRQWHLALCDCACVLDQTFGQLLMTTFVVDLAMGCFILYNVLDHSFDAFQRVMFAFWLCLSFVHVLVKSVAASLVHEA
ncbi:hypothetical protein BaRGS_00017704, partial [Batillaria attramentaria]